MLPDLKYRALDAQDIDSLEQTTKAVMSKISAHDLKFTWYVNGLMVKRGGHQLFFVVDNHVSPADLSKRFIISAQALYADKSLKRLFADELQALKDISTNYL